MRSLNNIDVIKGLAIICILFSNTINFWLDYNFESALLLSFIILLLEIFGSSLFIFIYSFSVIFTLKKRMGCKPEKENRNKIFKQGFLFILLGILYNLILSYFGSSILIFWGWNILIFIGFAQIVCSYAFKLARWARFVIGLTIILITPYIRELLFFGKESSIVIYVLYQIFVSFTPIYPFLPYASLWFFSTIFAELIYESIILESDIAKLRAARSIMKYGIIFIILSFLYSTLQFLPFIAPFSYSPFIFPFIDALPILRGSSIIYIPGIPESLIKGTVQNVFLIVGVSLLIFGLSYHKIDIKCKDHKFYKILNTYGKGAITLLFLQYIFLLIFNQSLIFYLFILISPLYLVIVGFIIYFWEKHLNLKLSLDWLIKKLTKIRHDEAI